ncbi:MAG: amino acid ABC transporter permease [Clostridia bacterium]|nr:amino acid ABC transporter permease [Clostridia bacterium]
MNNDYGLLWEKFVKTLIDKNGYKLVLEGLWNTVQIAVIGLLIGIVIGTIIAIVRVMPKYKLLPRILDKICGCYVELFRGTPMMVQLLIGYNVLLPILGISVDSGLPVAIAVFGLNSSAYVSEIMRSGINSVDAGQMEAGRAVGLSYWTTMFKIVIPQAVKNILPTLGNEFIVLVKETSITGYVATIDLTRAFTKLGSDSMSYVIPYLMLGVAYLIIVLLISWGVRTLEKKLKKSER